MAWGAARRWPTSLSLSPSHTMLGELGELAKLGRSLQPLPHPRRVLAWRRRRQLSRGVLDAAWRVFWDRNYRRRAVSLFCCKPRPETLCLPNLKDRQAVVSR